MNRSFLFPALVLGVVVSVLSRPEPARGENFIGDLSDRQVAINSNFTGRRITIFGAIDKTADSLSGGPSEGDLNIIVVVRGPQKPLVVRKKSRVFGIWVNTQSVTFPTVPVVYYVSSYRDLSEGDLAGLYRRYEIRMENLRLRADRSSVSADELQSFRQAILQLKQEKNLYRETSGSVRLTENLFRTEIDLPANVPVGAFNVEFYMFRGKTLVSSQSEPLYVNKTGIGRTIYEFSDDHPFWHGLFAVIAALLAGWLASLIYRRT